MFPQHAIKWICDIFKETNQVARENIYYIEFLMKNKLLETKKKLKRYNKLQQPVIIFDMLYNSFKFRTKSRKILSERNIFTIKGALATYC